MQVAPQGGGAAKQGVYGIGGVPCLWGPPGGNQGGAGQVGEETLAGTASYAVGQHKAEPGPSACHPPGQALRGTPAQAHADQAWPGARRPVEGRPGLSLPCKAGWRGARPGVGKGEGGLVPQCEVHLLKARLMLQPLCYLTVIKVSVHTGSGCHTRQLRSLAALRSWKLSSEGHHSGPSQGTPSRWGRSPGPPWMGLAGGSAPGSLRHTML